MPDTDGRCSKPFSILGNSVDMAASEHPTELQLIKYDKIRGDWTRFFERRCRHKLGTVRTFFNDFHKNHQQLEFTVAKIFDGSTQILVDTDGYTKIKKELERKTGQTLSDLRKYVFRNGVGYTFVERRSFASWSEYRGYNVTLERENENVKRRQCEQAASQAAKLRETIKEKPHNAFLAFDIEVYQQDSYKMLEIGFVKFGVHPDASKEYFHYIITDNIQYVNEGAFNNRNNYRYGESESLSLKEATERFQEHLATADSFVTHSGTNDEQFLSKQGISLPEKQMFDTQVLALVLLTHRRELRNLSGIMRELGVAFVEGHLHNAGNDAALTMEGFCGLVKKL